MEEVELEAGVQEDRLSDSLLKDDSVILFQNSEEEKETLANDDLLEAPSELEEDAPRDTSVTVKLENCVQNGESGDGIKIIYEVDEETNQEVVNTTHEDPPTTDAQSESATTAHNLDLLAASVLKLGLVSDGLLTSKNQNCPIGAA